MRMARVGKERAESVRQELARRDAVKVDFHIEELEGQVLIPISDEISDQELLALEVDIVEGDPAPRGHYRAPFEEIIREAPIPKELKDRLPHKWELLGDVLLMRLPADLIP